MRNSLATMFLERAQRLGVWKLNQQSYIPLDLLIAMNENNQDDLECMEHFSV